MQTTIIIIGALAIGFVVFKRLKKKNRKKGYGYGKSNKMIGRL